MTPFKLTVHQYRQKLISVFGYADPEMMQRYANDRAEYKRRANMADFNPFNADPGCKSCGKKNT